MNILYDKQKGLYNHYSLRTFLFISKKLNRSIEDPYSIRNNIRDHLKNYSVYINNTVFVLISVETIESILYTGSIIKKSYISDNDAVILNNGDISGYIDIEEDEDRYFVVLMYNFAKISCIFPASHFAPSEIKISSAAISHPLFT